jgi:hypothetical protein
LRSVARAVSARVVSFGLHGMASAWPDAFPVRSSRKGRTMSDTPATTPYNPMTIAPGMIMWASIYTAMFYALGGIVAYQLTRTR